MLESENLSFKRLMECEWFEPTKKLINAIKFYTRLSHECSSDHLNAA